MNTHEEKTIYYIEKRTLGEWAYHSRTHEEAEAHNTLANLRTNDPSTDYRLTYIAPAKNPMKKTDLKKLADSLTEEDIAKIILIKAKAAIGPKLFAAWLQVHNSNEPWHEVVLFGGGDNEGGKTFDEAATKLTAKWIKGGA